jgi:hypothetical protein
MVMQIRAREHVQVQLQAMDDDAFASLPNPGEGAFRSMSR